MPDRLQTLKPLRSWRVRPDRDDSIGQSILSAVRESSAKQRSAGGMVAAWESSAPVVLQKCCVATGGGKGVLTLRASSAPARFQLHRWLTSGGEQALRSGGVLRVKVL